MSLDDLRDKNAPLQERMEALHSSDSEEMDDAVAANILATVRDRSEPEELRAAAAISLGPVLEECDTSDFAEDEIFGAPVSKETFHAIQAALREVHNAADEPKLVRRRALEASVRAEADWHADAVRAAYNSGDAEWKATALFGMQYLAGFDQQILASIEDPDPDIRLEAIRAAGARDIPAAWPHIKGLLENPQTDRDLRLAAIEAAPFVSPDAAGILAELASDTDDEIAEAAQDALSFVDPGDSDEDFEEDEDEEEDLE
jgi:hypothetical protein